MTIRVDKLQRATLCFDRNSTVLDLIQALTENLGGEWDDAHLEPDLVGSSVTGGWRLVAVMESEEPNRPERWETEDGEHVAVWNATQKWRQCNCGAYGTDAELEAHLKLMAGDQ